MNESVSELVEFELYIHRFYNNLFLIFFFLNSYIQIINIHLKKSYSKLFPVVHIINIIYCILLLLFIDYFVS